MVVLGHVLADQGVFFGDCRGGSGGIRGVLPGTGWERGVFWVVGEFRESLSRLSLVRR